MADEPVMTEWSACDTIVHASQRSPHAVYLTGEDNLRVTVFNALAGVVVTVRGRFEDLKGDVIPFEDRVTPASDRTASNLTVRLAEGWLLNVHVFVSTGAPLTGQTFAIVSVIRGEGSSALTLATLVAGAITAPQRIGYPGSPIVNSLDSQGAVRAITGTTPGAAADVLETVPTGARWELLSIIAQLVTSATVANRIVELVLDDGANVIARATNNQNHAASTTIIYWWAQGGPTVNPAG